ncbi:neuronal-specific septin-3-like isoform X2 [Periophthalmus magnuspinnatus]|uniref:neuronal-specific septin-3-like isoform X2 n=1 Tax=Periophthalmus magnuspinnatus TaxID=409849 RepID=UPI00145A03DF|nr:neuronal-specific septin-3-like isoform X2 [Periophthalmus magnuspinnatus]
MERDRIAALKRSFEVEDVDTSAHSPGSRRTTSSPHRNAMSPTSIYYRDLGSAASAPNNNNVNFSQPRSIMGGGGSKTPEPVSRRSELSIDISSSSKQLDGMTSPASARSVSSALKRPEILGHSRTPEMGHKREVTFAKAPTDSPGTRRSDANSNNGFGREQQHHPRKLEAPSPGDARKPDISITRAPPENNGHSHPAVHHPHHPNPHHNTIVTTFRCASPSHGRKSPNPDRSEVSLGHTMSESAKQHAAKGDKSHAGDSSYVGIDAILEQMRRKAMKQGFELNIMVVGQSGLGKSTLMNTLFKSKVSRKSVQPDPEERIPKTVEIKSISHDIEEKGVRMKLTVIDTPGFGDQINNENCWQPIMKFINDQYEAYLQEEINIDRKKRIPDSRVHCCIYFIPPTGHCLRPLDVEFMRRLSKVVNIVPVIAKADTLTLEERDFFKQTIREGLRANGIDVYPQKEFDEDAEDRLINDKIREMIPFAVVGSDQEYQVNGKRILGRKTKWGTIEVENISHCEFAYLRDLLIRTHMQNIKDITGSIHYETYRVRRLNESNHINSQASGYPALQPKANGQTEPQPAPPQPNGVATQHEVMSHEM